MDFGISVAILLLATFARDQLVKAAISRIPLVLFRFDAGRGAVKALVRRVRTAI